MYSAFSSLSTLSLRAIFAATALQGVFSLDDGGSLNQMVSEGCHQACTQLSETFAPAFHYPDRDNFTIWDAKQQEVRPACRVEPSSASDVARILSILTDKSCRFAVKGGGHSRHIDDSNSVGGVTIDLDRIHGVEIAADGTRARVGGGATTLQVYSALELRNLSFVGGRVDTVGIGGFTLGGGTSPFSNKYGWALDNVYEYETKVVLANGTIATASEEHNPDLYFALRGGGNNFGIVVTFTVRTFPQGPVLNARTTYNDSQTEEVLDKVYDLFVDPELSSDADMGFDLYYTYLQASDSFTLSGTQRYAKPIANPPVFEAIDEIAALSRSATIDTMANLVANPQPLGTTRHLFGTVSVLPSRVLLSQGIRIFKEEVEAIKTVEGLVPNFISYPLQRNAIREMRQRGGNALGIDQDEPLFIVLISTAWSGVQGDASVTTMTTNTLNRIKSAAEELGVAHPYRYMNYAMASQADEIFAGYGDGNAQRLREIQRAVDPSGVFTSQGLWRGFIKLL
ncbi:putative FAD binding domain protein [Botryosphaeria dothidea]|uniref:FAD binding domain protein n=1 Tax=Botryosphaeria dothidea TaxID=55169 RepID=A0A8H4NGK6_9PEZI|nr:putative FAD binding domain protein [Botryosphaeria dothidea]